MEGVEQQVASRVTFTNYFLTLDSNQQEPRPIPDITKYQDVAITVNFHENNVGLRDDYSFIHNYN